MNGLIIMSAIFIFACLLVNMQYSIILNNYKHGFRIRLKLISSLLCSFVIPFFPLIHFVTNLKSKTMKMTTIED
jgi:hypothetical protein